jgi:hypothetical protein
MPRRPCCPCQVHFAYELRELLEVHSFFSERLGISERRVRTITWPEVAHRLVQVRRGRPGGLEGTGCVAGSAGRAQRAFAVRHRGGQPFLRGGAPPWPATRWGTCEPAGPGDHSALHQPRPKRARHRGAHHAPGELPHRHAQQGGAGDWGSCLGVAARLVASSQPAGGQADGAPTQPGCSVAASQPRARARARPPAQGVLALNTPIPGLRRRMMLTKTLEWNLHW